MAVGRQGMFWLRRKVHHGREDMEVGAWDSHRLWCCVYKSLPVAAWLSLFVWQLGLLSQLIFNSSQTSSPKAKSR